MAAEMVFGGGHRIRVSTTNAEGLALTLNRPKHDREIRSARGSILPPGWIEIQADEGVVLVNPDQVAYVLGLDDMPQAEETTGGLSDLSPAQVRGRP
jgi:hypothetical protein